MPLWDDTVINTSALSALFGGVNSATLRRMRQQQSEQDDAVWQLGQMIRMAAMMAQPKSPTGQEAAQDTRDLLNIRQFEEAQKAAMEDFALYNETDEEKSLRLAREELEAFLRHEE